MMLKLTQGEIADAFYIIEEGEVLITVHGCPIRKMGAKEYFGEAALIDPNAHGKRTATVTALKPLICFR